MTKKYDGNMQQTSTITAKCFANYISKIAIPAITNESAIS